MKTIINDNCNYGRFLYDFGVEYDEWWFCCFPISFENDSDTISFLIYCDDVKYILDVQSHLSLLKAYRCGLRHLINV